MHRILKTVSLVVLNLDVFIAMFDEFRSVAFLCIELFKLCLDIDVLLLVLAFNVLLGEDFSALLNFF